MPPTVCLGQALGLPYECSSNRCMSVGRWLQQQAARGCPRHSPAWPCMLQVREREALGWVEEALRGVQESVGGTGCLDVTIYYTGGRLDTGGSSTH